jgi:hypothetical protein
VMLACFFAIGLFTAGYQWGADAGAPPRDKVPLAVLAGLLWPFYWGWELLWSL